jgi:hypothetical protein
LALVVDFLVESQTASQQQAQAAWEANCRRLIVPARVAAFRCTHNHAFPLIARHVTLVTCPDCILAQQAADLAGTHKTAATNDVRRVAVATRTRVSDLIA